MIQSLNTWIHHHCLRDLITHTYVQSDQMSSVNGKANPDALEWTLQDGLWQPCGRISLINLMYTVHIHMLIICHLELDVHLFKEWFANVKRIKSCHVQKEMTGTCLKKQLSLRHTLLLFSAALCHCVQMRTDALLICQMLKTLTWIFFLIKWVWGDSSLTWHWWKVKSPLAQIYCYYYTPELTSDIG